MDSWSVTQLRIVDGDKISRLAVKHGSRQGLADKLAQIAYPALGEGTPDGGTVYNNLKKAQSDPFPVVEEDGDILPPHSWAPMRNLVRALRYLSGNCGKDLLRLPPDQPPFTDELDAEFLRCLSGAARAELDLLLGVRDVISSLQPPKYAVVSEYDPGWAGLYVALIAILATGKSVAVPKPDRLLRNLVRLVPGATPVEKCLSNVIGTCLRLRERTPTPDEAQRALAMSCAILPPSWWLSGVTLKGQGSSWVLEVTRADRNDCAVLRDLGERAREHLARVLEPHRR